MKKDAKRLIKDAEDAGFVYESTNSKSADRYVHPDGRSFLLTQGAGEHAVRQIRVAVGLDTRAPKRNAAAVHDRQAKERDRQRQEREQHAAQLERLQVEKDQLLAGHGAHLTPEQVVAISARIEKNEQEIRRYTQLMTETPEAGSHCGTGRPARHQAGAA